MTAIRPCRPSQHRLSSALSLWYQMHCDEPPSSMSPVARCIHEEILFYSTAALSHKLYVFSSPALPIQKPNMNSILTADKLVTALFMTSIPTFSKVGKTYSAIALFEVRILSPPSSVQKLLKAAKLGTSLQTMG